MNGQSRIVDKKAIDFNSLKTTLSNASFDSAYVIFADIEDIVCYTTELILTTCAEFIPNKVVTIRLKDTQWMSNASRRAIRKREVVNMKTKCCILLRDGS